MNKGNDKEYKVIIKEGTIYIITSISLGPFFKDEYEETFQSKRLDSAWRKLVGFTNQESNEETGMLCTSEIFTYDKDERELEKKYYDIKALRGITYNELFTPTYKLNSNAFNCNDALKDDYTQNISDNDNYTNEEKKTKQTLLKIVLKKTKDILGEWSIKIQITKDGLANVFFENKFPQKNNSNYSMDVFAQKKRKLLSSPYSDLEELCKYKNKQDLEKGIKELWELNNDGALKTEIIQNKERLVKNIKKLKLLKKEQILNSYLNAAAIWITHIFLRECDNKIRQMLRIGKNKDRTDYLEYPWGVRYKEPFIVDSPPIRNTNFIFYFYVCTKFSIIFFIAVIITGVFCFAGLKLLTKRRYFWRKIKDRIKNLIDP